MTDSGKAYPLGASLTAEGCNFAIYCPDAGSVELCLFRSDTEEMLDEFLLDSKTGAVWHIHIEGVKAGQLYAYRTVNLDGAEQQRDKLLIDPYARQLNRSCQWNPRQYQNDSQFMLPKCVVTEPTASLNRANFDKQRPRIIYEAHVKGLSQLHPEVPQEQRGTYIGAAHPSILKHLCQLGVTTIQFLPIASFMPEPFITEKGLTNYWGYNPVNFFAVEPRYACANAFIECKEMVKAYHQVGLEVIVDVVFNHTAEGGDSGTTLSFKGLCRRQAYSYQSLMMTERNIPITQVVETVLMSPTHLC
jgi:glycogen operon protein